MRLTWAVSAVCIAVSTVNGQQFFRDSAPESVYDYTPHGLLAYVTNEFMDGLSKFVEALAVPSHDRATQRITETRMRIQEEPPVDPIPEEVQNMRGLVRKYLANRRQPVKRGSEQFETTESEHVDGAVVVSPEGGIPNSISLQDLEDSELARLLGTPSRLRKRRTSHDVIMA